MTDAARGVEAWDRLWTPHRKHYLENEAGTHSATSCPFCLDNDESNRDLVVVESSNAFVVLNKYPYSSGHLLVCTVRHVATLDLLTSAEVADVGLLTQQAMRTLREVSGAKGFNIGLNQGSVAGAGIADHFHQHIVPRWAGDSNFMPIIGGTRVMPELLADTKSVLQEFWQH